MTDEISTEDVELLATMDEQLTIRILTLLNNALSDEHPVSDEIRKLANVFVINLDDFTERNKYQSPVGQAQLQKLWADQLNKQSAQSDFQKWINGEDTKK